MISVTNMHTVSVASMSVDDWQKWYKDGMTATCCINSVYIVIARIAAAAHIAEEAVVIVNLRLRPAKTWAWHSPSLLKTLI